MIDRTQKAIGCPGKCQNLLECDGCADDVLGVASGQRLRAHSKITSHFRISASSSSAAAQSRNPRNSPLFLWVHSIAATKSDLNLSANSANLFLSEP